MQYSHVGLHHKQAACTTHPHQPAHVPVSHKQRQPIKWAPTVCCVSTPALPWARTPGRAHRKQTTLLPACRFACSWLHMFVPRTHPEHTHHAYVWTRARSTVSPVHHITQGTDEEDTRYPAFVQRSHVAASLQAYRGCARALLHHAQSCAVLQHPGIKHTTPTNCQGSRGSLEIPPDPTSFHALSRRQ